MKIELPTQCRHCQGTNFTWHTHITCINMVPHNRQNANDMACRFVLGCEDCSETLRVLDADQIAEAMNTPPDPLTGEELYDLHKGSSQYEMDAWADVPEFHADWDALARRVERKP